MKSEDLVWYVSYGSNTNTNRFLCYLQGGRPSGSARRYVGARDRTPPRASVAVTLPGRVYFAGQSPVWGGGAAFYDPEPFPGGALARAWLVTAEQFADVVAQEMGGEAGSGRHLDLDTVLREGRDVTGRGWYETILRVDVPELDDYPAFTFTCATAAEDRDHVAPAPAYLATIAAGLAEVHGVPQGEAVQRLLGRALA